MLKKRYKILFKILIIILIINVFIIYFGKKYLIRFDEFIYENNNIIIKNELNRFIKNISLGDNNSLYNFRYNNDNEIVGANFNSFMINKYLGEYISKFENNLNNLIYNDYIYKYGKNFKTSNNKYLYVPLGIIYNNPFLYNIGPNIILSYDFINTFTFKVDMDVKNYGYNNILIMLYLNVTVDQSVVKPVLKKATSTNYKFLLSSNIVYGRVSSILNNGFSLQSDAI